LYGLWWKPNLSMFKAKRERRQAEVLMTAAVIAVPKMNFKERSVEMARLKSR